MKKYDDTVDELFVIQGTIEIQHHVRYCLEPGKKKANRKPLTELHVKEQFTEDRGEWQKEPQRHCEEVYTDLEETKEAQECRSEYFKKEGNLQFTQESRSAEIPVDFVLQARDRLSDNKVNGLEDAIVSEMIKKLLMENIDTVARCFQERFMGFMDSPSSWKVVKLFFLRKPDTAPKKGINSYRAIAFDIGGVKVVCILYPSFSGEGKGVRKVEESTCWWSGWDKLPTPTGIGDEFIAKTLGMARRKESRDETWYSGKIDIVNGKLGHQDDLR